MVEIRLAKLVVVRECNLHQDGGVGPVFGSVVSHVVGIPLVVCQEWNGDVGCCVVFLSYAFQENESTV